MDHALELKFGGNVACPCHPCQPFSSFAKPFSPQIQGDCFGETSCRRGMAQL
eukprot:CAMPEP_0172667132 /NCGR_PEP_ID=MMETSP1074-20121228/8229_1 /TAXON_ID=2916 /ORGANISM="Ceratium fusus, Strain PA161109" /LENGTH=51 /DNA_ID=CAMNT_0013483599 /DNA_START=939 /DNA_END=1094 /DNA_ORIENTATION=-